VSFNDADGNSLLATNQQQTLRHAVAGCFELLPHCMPILAPNQNSIRRLGGTVNVATQTVWGYEDRDACLHIPNDSKIVRII
jgi:glutamine synthetase